MELSISGKEGEGKTTAVKICVEALTKAGYKCNTTGFRHVTKETTEESLFFDRKEN